MDGDGSWCVDFLGQKPIEFVVVFSPTFAKIVRVGKFCMRKVFDFEIAQKVFDGRPLTAVTQMTFHG